METIPDTWNAPSLARIEEIRPITADTSLFRLRLMNPGKGGACRFTPGQFFQISVPGGGEVPISPASPPGKGGEMELCVRRVGHVTSMLHGLKTGESLGIRGPFGRGFPLERMQGRNLFLLAGGVGIAPLRSLLYHILADRGAFGEITIMYGAREPALLLFRDELAALSGRTDMRLLITVDFLSGEPPAGLSCKEGLLPSLLNGGKINSTRSCAIVCGPPPLYRCLVGELARLGFPASSIFLSLERRMKCGVGRCSHCAVGGLLCCTDGPVFSWADLQGIEGAI